MPTYEFRCPAGHDFEQFYRKISDAPLSLECPTCGKVAERLVSAGAGLHFKGSGFYITDYGKDGKKDLKRTPEPKKKTESESGASASGESPKADSGSAPADSAKSESSKPGDASAKSDKGGTKPE